MTATETPNRRARIERRTRETEVLVELDYLTSADDQAQVTEEGQLLMGLYTEADLLTALCLRSGTWDELTPAELAAVCSTLVFEARSSDDESPKVPNGPIRAAFEDMQVMWSDIHEIEASHGLHATRMMDSGFVWPVYRWCQGNSLYSILTREDLTAGDFVRWSRQVIDLLGQISQVVPADHPLRFTASKAADLVNRGVVASVAKV